MLDSSITTLVLVCSQWSNKRVIYPSGNQMMNFDSQLHILLPGNTQKLLSCVDTNIAFYILGIRRIEIHFLLQIVHYT